MFKRPFILEAILATILSALLFVLVVPFGTDRDPKIHIYVIFIALIVHLSKVFVISLEPHEDERDVRNKHISSWVSYLTVSTLLVLGIAYQEINTGVIDIWLPLSLAGLYLSKLATHAYLHYFK